MRGDILLLPHYAFMVWCSVKKAQGQWYEMPKKHADDFTRVYPKVFGLSR
jgi:hypothetical protein